MQFRTKQRHAKYLLITFPRKRKKRAETGPAIKLEKSSLFSFFTKKSHFSPLIFSFLSVSDVRMNAMRDKEAELMAQEIFKRYEKKYLLTDQQYSRLFGRLSREMCVDEYGKHRISNIYFDTKDYELIRTSIEKPEYKEKLRLRVYGTATEDSMAFVELKKKYDGIVYKRRIPMPLSAAEKYLFYGIRPREDGQILREIDYTFRRYDLKPAAYIAYERLAMFGKQDSQLRVTFDKNVCGRSYAMDLRCGFFGTPVMEKGAVLMEVKVPGAMPLWMSSLFSELKIYPASFSKYGTYYQKELCRNCFPAGCESFVTKGYVMEGIKYA